MIPGIFCNRLKGWDVEVMEVMIPTVIITVWWKPGADLLHVYHVSREVFQDSSRVGAVQIIFKEGKDTVAVVVSTRDEFEKWVGGHLRIEEWIENLRVVSYNKLFSVDGGSSW